MIYLFVGSFSFAVAQTGLVDTFTNNNLPGWNETGDYELNASNGVLQIDANKRDTWNSFTFTFSPICIFCPVLYYIPIRV